MRLVETSHQRLTCHAVTAWHVNLWEVPTSRTKLFIHIQWLSVAYLGFQYEGEGRLSVGVEGVGVVELHCLAPPQKKIYHFLSPKTITMHFDALFNRQKTRTDSLEVEALRNGFYGSIAKRNLQKQCKNYPKIHGQTRGGGRSCTMIPSPPPPPSPNTSLVMIINGCIIKLFYEKNRTLLSQYFVL